MLGYRVPRPDQAMLISGGKQKVEGTTFRVVIGHGAWVLPGFRKVGFLGLNLHTVEIEEKCRSNEGIMLNLKAVAAFKVQCDPSAVNAAAQRFLGEQREGEMEAMTRRIFAGHLRSIVGSMKVVDIHRNRDALAIAIMDHSQTEMSRLGLTVDSLQIEHLDDDNIGYLDNLAKPHLAEAQRDAQMASARAEQESAQAVQEAERKKVDQIRETELKKAGIKSEVDKAQAEAEAAGQLAKAQVDSQVLEKQQAVADMNAILTERELVAQVIKPAEADAKKMRIIADAEASKAEAEAKQAEWQAAAAKTRQVKAAEGEAEKMKVEAAASRDAALFRAEGTEAEGRAAATAKEVMLLADARGKEAMGKAEGAGELAKAEALAANQGAQLERLRIEALPNAMAAAAKSLGLGNANLNITNGAEGLGQVFAVLSPAFNTLTEMASQFIAGKIAEHTATTNGEVSDEDVLAVVVKDKDKTTS